MLHVAKMYLFQFRFTYRPTENSIEVASTVPSYLPQMSECGLGREEHSNITTTMLELVNPSKRRKTQGVYIILSNTQMMGVSLMRVCIVYVVIEIV